MKGYNFIPYNNDDRHQYDNESAVELKRLIEVCDFIVFNGLPDTAISEIKGVGDSLRGTTIEFKDGGMTYGYNINGGYQKQ